MADTRTARVSGRDRVLQKMALWLVRLLYRHVAVFRAGPPRPDGPELSVANHFGGAADALLLMAVLPRRPRIIARDTIWKIPLVGLIMRWLGAIPVHKPEDPGPNRNDEMFRSCYQALADGGNLLIFPEGVTRDDPSIAPLKTGAARIVLGARAGGTQQIHITPVGLHYEDKAALRSRVFVYVGTELDLDAEAAGLDQPAAASNRAAVQALTSRIDEALRRVAPNFEDWREARALTDAAAIVLRTAEPGQKVSLGERDRIAAVLGRRPRPAREEIIEAVASYDDALAGLGVSDDQVVRQEGRGGLLLRLASHLGVALLLAPFALVGLAINWLPFLIVRLLGRLPVAPAVLATVKPLAATGLFGVTWGLVAWGAFELIGWRGPAVVLLLMPVYLFAVVLLGERLVLAWRTLRRWVRAGRSAAISDRLAADRRRVVEAVEHAR